MLHSSQLLSSPLEIVSGSIKVGDLDVTLQAGYRGSLVNSSVLFDDVYGLIDRDKGILGVENKAVADSEVSMTISESGLRIDAVNNPGFYFVNPGRLEREGVLNSGNLVFNITEDSFFDYSWGERPGLFDSYTGALSLENASGDLILECVRTVFCFQGSSGRLYLAQGEYVLSYGAFSMIAAGTVIGSEISFTLEASPVPIPAAVWLFISGLAGLFIRIR